MNREVIPYTDEATWLAERAKDLTSTEVAALWNLSPYMTRFELWHRKHGGTNVAFEENERTKWGKRLQHAIAQGVADEQGFLLRSMPEYIRLTDKRVGASFDYCDAPHYDGGEILGQCAGMPTFILECKNVDSLEFRNGWLETDYGLEAPAHIECQVQHQLLVSGLTRAYIAALVGGNRVVLLERTYHEPTGEGILREAATFWAETEPAPLWPNDAAFVASLYSYSEPGKVANADDETAALFREYAGYRAIAKSMTESMDTCKAQILMRVGDAEKVLHPAFSLSAKMIKTTHIEAHDRAGYRGFKLYERKV